MRLFPRQRIVFIWGLILLVSAGCQTMTEQPDVGVAPQATVASVTPSSMSIEPSATKPIATETSVTPPQAMGTAELPALGAEMPSSGSLSSEVVHHILAEEGAPEHVPADLEWTVEQVEGSQPNRRWFVIYERSNPFVWNGEDSQWEVLRLRIEDAATQTPVVVLDSIWPRGIVSWHLRAVQDWSEGEDGFYLGYPAEGLYGGGGCDPFGGLFNGLYWLALPSGELNEIISPIDWNRKVIGMSPNEQWVAYTVHDQARGVLTVREMTAGQETQFDLSSIAPPWELGSFTWSPDSSRVAFVYVTNTCLGGPHSTTVYRASIEDGTVSEISTDPQRYLVIKSWTLEERILMEDRADYWLNPETGEIKTNPN